ncbi:hypothetical protein PAAG_11320 [Paracoccidioides lutzii Pb01]|uniref:Uncharacterized protein n=1 Tax=Paracoccidioides lutzii (strain ATCC MYA-826 / Pb01) TaxID=502779 RepID=A0A0A2VM32_PARBA|nr:hypothetical protein PAAG_11320 [Paracoccidioides lutzii Pb01]KGQ01929.1 hypothetical protein PAAG_11320 [Paracoccidioides lutzii Pb01]
MRALILEADIVVQVFVQVYRPGVHDEYGLGLEDILDLCKDRNRVVIYVREISYGWYGPCSGRSGWQPISDAPTEGSEHAETNSGTELFKQDVFKDRESQCIGKVIHVVKQVLQLPDGKVEL